MSDAPPLAEGATTLVPPPLALYVHIPWCVKKCPYCDFNSHEGRGTLPFAAYVDALVADLDHDLPLAWGRTVQTVFFDPGNACTAAELDPAIKNAISHRGLALAALKQRLPEFI